MSTNDLTKPVYTVSQLSTLCGISRSGILRLQEEGLFLPSKQDSRGDRRLYSYLDIMKLCQIVILHDYGFTHSTIREFFEDNSNYSTLISLLAARQTQLYRYLNEIQARIPDAEELETEYIYSPEIICHTKTAVRHFPYYDLHREMVHDQIDEIIAKKYCISIERPLCITTPWEDLGAGAPFDEEREFTACIPLSKLPQTEDPAVRIYPRMRMLSLMIKGPHIPMEGVISRIRSEINDNRLNPAGPLYILSFVGPHLGRNIPPERYLARVMLPIEE